MTFKTLSDEGQQKYVPLQNVVVCKEGKNQERANVFVKDILSEEVKKMSGNMFMEEGLPVNKNAFTYWLSRPSAFCKEYTLSDGIHYTDIQTMTEKEKKK